MQNWFRKKSASRIEYELTRDTLEVSTFIDTNMAALQQNTRDLMLVLGVLGGDRLACCDEVVLARDANDHRKVVGVCTLSVEGERHDGQAGLVGRFVLPAYRRRGIGQQLYLKGIERLQERIEAGETSGPIRIDHLTKEASAGMKKLLAEHHELQVILDLHDHSDKMSL